MNKQIVKALLLSIALVAIQAVKTDINVEMLNQELFSTIYRLNIWSHPESRSGPGSSMEQTNVIRVELPKILKKYNIEVFVDAPCGDFNWMQKIDLSFLTRYIGIDIVPDVILENLKHYANAKQVFLHLDITHKDFPQALGNLPANSVILCRDCLTHLSFKDIFAALRNFKKTGARYVLISTYPGPQRKSNVDLQGANLLQLLRYRPINFQLPPFNFPKPLEIFNEGDTEGQIDDKSLALWNLDSLPLDNNAY